MTQPAYFDLIDELVDPSDFRDDIKEMTVKYLESVKHDNDTEHLTECVAMSFVAGFMTCVNIIQVDEKK